ncbi:MAG: sortase [Actinomycetota bacterium]|nr:sortase [Actinomycetota bacterium]
MTTLAHHRATPPPQHPGYAVIRVIGEVLITLGIVVFLFIAYELWFTGLFTARAQSNLKEQLKVRWATTAPVVPSASPSAGATAPAVPAVAPELVLPGDAIGLIRIPRLGANYGFAIVEGVSTSDLQKGPGHYPGTAGPGQIGNFVLSGHRTTYLAPFNGLGDLAKGDAIVIETRDTYYTYRVTELKVVLPTEVGVVLPVPDTPRAKPTQALITLTTCTPKYSATHRLIVDGLLESALPKAAGPPPALTAGAGS